MRLLFVVAAASVVGYVGSAADKGGPYGTCSHIGRGGYWTRTNTFEMVRSMRGLDWLRVDFVWERMQRKDGTLDFCIYDQILADADAYGIRILPILGGAPDGDRYGNFDGWCKFVRETVLRYGRKCRVFEIVNEPGHKGTFDVPRYAKYFAAAAAEIRKIDPNIKVMIGEFGAERTAGVFKNGAGANCDILNVHPYSFHKAPWLPEGVVDTEIERHIRIPLEIGLKPMPVWVTEVGWPTIPDPPVAQVIRASLAKIDAKKSNWRVAYVDSVEEDSYRDVQIKDLLEIAFPKGCEISVVSSRELKGMLTAGTLDVVVYPFDMSYLADVEEAVLAFVDSGGILVDFMGKIRNADKYHLAYIESEKDGQCPPLIVTAPVADVCGITTRGKRFEARVYLSRARLRAGDEFLPILAARTNGCEYVSAAVVRLDGGRRGTVVTSTIYDHWFRTSNESRQARLLARAAGLAFASGAQKFFWYKGRSWETTPDDGTHHFGFARRDWSPKPAQHAYEVFMKMRPSGSENVPCRWKDPKEGFYFPQWIRPDGRRAGMVWKTKPSGKVCFRLEGNGVKFFDLYGTQTDFSVSDTPIYFLDGEVRND